MDRNNTLGVTVRVHNTLDPFSNVDWDSITVVSMQSIPDQGHECAPFYPRLFPAGRRRSIRSEWHLALNSAWGHLGSRLCTSIRNVRRQLPAVFRTLSSNFAGHSSRTHAVVPHPIFAVSISTYLCAACQNSTEVMQDAVLTPCGHRYHAKCIVALVVSSMQSLASFPPQCCRQSIPTNVFERYLTRVHRVTFAARQSEYATPKRVYCANPRCSHFLGARDKRLPIRVYTCPTPSCATRTCARCKAHVDTPTARHECSHDLGHRATLRLGSRMGWVRCPTCEELIERNGGCAHMTCMCGAQFCYRCRALWKTCNCVDWGDGVGVDAWEGRLFAPLEEGGDLGARLALFIPPGNPVLEQNLNASGDGFGDGDEESDGGDARLAIERSSSQATFQTNRPRRPLVDPELVETSAATTYLADSPKVCPAPESPTWLEPETTCFPFFVDPYLLARGVQAQEIRMRRRV